MFQIFLEKFLQGLSRHKKSDSLEAEMNEPKRQSKSVILINTEAKEARFNFIIKMQKPLETWRNERLVFKTLASGEVQCIGIEKGTAADNSGLLQMERKREQKEFKKK
ncbi:hypothetical protein TNCT_479831 [Trichonephila clavata]|uniref:Uncharacterized protein n=1 Tax=Trichonephila clavata TaxID=2740835 RepID=A0A8X6F5A0_TRICU|nr:hypothetical protein TNCT_479831 [Trichonephila clavata]